MHLVGVAGPLPGYAKLGIAGWPGQVCRWLAVRVCNLFLGLLCLGRYFGNKGKSKKIEEVDMKGTLEKAGLLQLFHDDLWPASAAVRELATVCKTKNGFVFSDLRKFLPNCCDNFVAVVMDVDKTGNEIVVVRDNIKSLPGRGRLSLAMWQAAWDRYALALTMVGRLPFHYAVRYKQVRRFVGAGGAWYVCVLEGDSGGGNGCCV